MVKQLRNLRLLQEQPYANGGDFIKRNEQIAAAIIKNNQLIEHQRRAINDSLDHRANEAWPLRGINDFAASNQSHSNLPSRLDGCDQVSHSRRCDRYAQQGFGWNPFG